MIKYIEQSVNNGYIWIKGMWVFFVLFIVKIVCRFTIISEVFKKFLTVICKGEKNAIVSNNGSQDSATGGKICESDIKYVFLT